MLNLLKKVTTALENENIEYMISGSMALVTYTIPRMTRDIDIIVELKMTDVDKFMAIFEQGYYAHRPAIEEAIKRQEMFNIIDFESGAKIDFMFIMKDTPLEIQELQRIIWMRKPLRERVRLGMEMIDEGFAIVRRSIQISNPSFNEREVVMELFKRLYGNEFSEEEQKPILEFLKGTKS